MDAGARLSAVRQWVKIVDERSRTHDGTQIWLLSAEPLDGINYALTSTLLVHIGSEYDVVSSLNALANAYAESPELRAKALADHRGGTFLAVAVHAESWAVGARVAAMQWTKSGRKLADHPDRVDVRSTTVLSVDGHACAWISRIDDPDQAGFSQYIDGAAVDGLAAILAALGHPIPAAG